MFSEHIAKIIHAIGHALGVVAENVVEQVHEDIEKVKDIVEKVKAIPKEQRDAQLDALAATHTPPYKWRTSSEDLLKTVDLPATKLDRKDLYEFYGGKGAYAGTYEQNVWLHKQIMDDLERSGLPL